MMTQHDNEQAQLAKLMACCQTSTGGQPTIEEVHQAHAESMGLMLSRESWMLKERWRQGRNCGAIVCDPPPGHVDEGGHVEFYGGLPVLESCPPSVIRHIVDIYNEKIGVEA